MYFLILSSSLLFLSLPSFLRSAAVIVTACAALEQSPPPPTPLMLPLPVNVSSPTSSHDSQSSKTSQGGESRESATKESKFKKLFLACQDRAFLPAPARTGAAGATSNGTVNSNAVRAPEPGSGESGRCSAEQSARETVVGESSGEGERGVGASVGSAAMRRAKAAATWSSVGGGCGSSLDALVIANRRLSVGAGRRMRLWSISRASGSGGRVEEEEAREEIIVKSFFFLRFFLLARDEFWFRFHFFSRSPREKKTKTPFPSFETLKMEDDDGYDSDGDLVLSLVPGLAEGLSAAAAEA